MFLSLFFSSDTWSQSYQTLISSFFWFFLLSLAISKYRQYFLMLQTLKLTNKKRKKSLFYEEKSLVGLTPGWKTLSHISFQGEQNIFNTHGTPGCSRISGWEPLFDLSWEKKSESSELNVNLSDRNWVCAK
jgi:hypothetical protein